MTQREQVRMHVDEFERNLKDALQAYTYTPARRADREEAQMLSRLADKAVALAAEHGEVLTRREAIARARCNLRDVRVMAGVK